LLEVLLLIILLLIIALLLPLLPLLDVIIDVEDEDKDVWIRWTGYRYDVKRVSGMVRE